jgi:hypothetical protein
VSERFSSDHSDTEVQYGSWFQKISVGITASERFSLDHSIRKVQSGSQLQRGSVLATVLEWFSFNQRVTKVQSGPVKKEQINQSFNQPINQ